MSKLKLFISWSGDHAKKLGEVFRSWIPTTLQFVRPYFTPEDIQKGQLWDTQISAELESSSFGIVIATSESLKSSWVNFEAGALSKRLSDAKVVPVLFGLDAKSLSGPLSRFQVCSFNKEDMHKLCKSINLSAGDNSLEPETLDAAFLRGWSDLQEKIDAISVDEHTPPPAQPASELSDITKKLLSAVEVNMMIVRHNNSETLSIVGEKLSKMEQTIDRLRLRHPPLHRPTIVSMRDALSFIGPDYSVYSATQIESLILFLDSFVTFLQQNGFHNSSRRVNEKLLGIRKFRSLSKP